MGQGSEMISSCSDDRREHPAVDAAMPDFVPPVQATETDNEGRFAVPEGVSVVDILRFLDITRSERRAREESKLSTKPPNSGTVDHGEKKETGERGRTPAVRQCVLFRDGGAEEDAGKRSKLSGAGDGIPLPSNWALYELLRQEKSESVARLWQG